MEVNGNYGNYPVYQSKDDNQISEISMDDVIAVEKEMNEILNDPNFNSLSIEEKRLKFPPPSYSELKDKVNNKMTSLQEKSDTIKNEIKNATDPEVQSKLEEQFKKLNAEMNDLNKINDELNRFMYDKFDALNTEAQSGNSPPLERPFGMK